MMGPRDFIRYEGARFISFVMCIRYVYVRAKREINDVIKAFSSTYFIIVALNPLRHLLGSHIKSFEIETATGILFVTANDP